jgi:hypothetical protein
MGLRFYQIRDSLIDDCYFAGWAKTGSFFEGSVGIQFDGQGDYSGNVDIRHCQFDNQYLGIALSGSNTTVRITGCEFVSSMAASNSIGVALGPHCSGVVIQACTFYGYGIGVYCQGAYLRQMNNYFEAIVNSDWWWVNGGFSGSQINNCSIGDVNIGANNRCTYPASQGCKVFGPTYLQI